MPEVPLDRLPDQRGEGDDGDRAEDEGDRGRKVAEPGGGEEEGGVVGGGGLDVEDKGEGGEEEGAPGRGKEGRKEGRKEGVNKRRKLERERE